MANPFVLGRRLTLPHNPAQPQQIELSHFPSCWLALLMSGLFKLMGL